MLENIQKYEPKYIECFINRQNKKKLSTELLKTKRTDINKAKRVMITKSEAIMRKK